MTETASKSDLSALLERVREAKGADREVDAAIMFDLFAEPVGRKDDGGPAGYLWREDNPSWSFGIRFPGKGREWFANCRKEIDGETLLIEGDGAFVLMNALRIPKLTASIDSALALVERVLPGWEWRIVRGGYAELLEYIGAGEDRMGRLHSQMAATPPLAILAALLSALIAKEQGNDE